MAKTKSQLLSKIDFLLVDIQSQYAEIKRSADIDIVELTLLEANIAALGKHIEALKIHTSSQTSTVPSVATEVQETIFTPATETKKELDTQKVVEEIPGEEPIVNQSKEEEFPFAIEKENIETEIPAVEDIEDKYAEQEEEQPQIIVETVVIPEKVVEVEVEAIEAKEEPKEPTRPLSINELIQQQKQAGKNATQQFQTSSTKETILDLKTAVSLNDKLLYIKDLFNGYSLAYSEAIELVNRFDNFAEADAFLQANYAIKNNWSEKPSTVNKFYDLLHKKFII